MFYTDGSETNPYGQCMNDQNPALTGSNFPDDVSVPLPSNPALEEKAHGPHHHGGMGGSKSVEDDDDKNQAQDGTTLPPTTQPPFQG